MKKWLLILLPIMLFLVSCSAEKEEIAMVTVMTEGDGKYWEEIEIDGVEVYVVVVEKGQLVNRVLLAEKKPDIVCLNSKEDMEAMSEVLINAEEIELDGYDRAKFANENYEEIEARHASASGKHCVFPDYSASRDGVARAWLYRADVFESLGLEPPETMSELTGVCIKLKKEFPDSTPLVIRDGYYGLDLLAPAWKNDASIGAYYDFEKEKWCYGLEEPWAGNFISHWANMARNGLISKEFLTMKNDEADALIAEGKAFIVPDYVWKTGAYNNSGADWRIMPAPRADIETGQHKIAKREAPFNGIALLNKSEHVLKVVDKYFLESCERPTVKSEMARIAEVYTEDKINPARYTTVPESEESIRVAIHLQGVLPAFLKGEIPMKRWEEYAKQLPEKGTKELLNRRKSAYNGAKK